jgi:hypothetical protein
LTFVLLSADSNQLPGLSESGQVEQPPSTRAAPTTAIESVVLAFVTAGFRAYCRRTDQKLLTDWAHALRAES